MYILHFNPAALSAGPLPCLGRMRRTSAPSVMRRRNSLSRAEFPKVGQRRRHATKNRSPVRPSARTVRLEKLPSKLLKAWRSRHDFEHATYGLGNRRSIRLSYGTGLILANFLAVYFWLFFRSPSNLRDQASYSLAELQTTAQVGRLSQSGKNGACLIRKDVDSGHLTAEIPSK